MASDRSPPSAAAVAHGGGGASSPQSRQQRSLHSPWASVVRGDSEQNSSPTAAASPPSVEEASAADKSLVESTGLEPQFGSFEINVDSNAGGQRRPAWNRPQNGDVGPTSVMGGALSWPALSDAIRPVTRSLSDPSGGESAPSPQASVISQSPQRLASSSSPHGNHGNSHVNNPNSTRSRSRNRGGGGCGGGGGGGGGGGHSERSGPSQNTFNHPSPPMPPPFPGLEVPYGMIPVLDNSLRGPRPIGGGVGPSQSHTRNDHSSNRGNSRRGNYGSRPRGDGQYNNNHGVRRDQDRRDVHPPQYVSPPLGYSMPPPLPPGAAPFMRPFPGPMGYDMGPPFIHVPPIPPGSFRTMPIVPPLPPPMVLPPANENTLTSMIVNQIDFYFSDDNLVKDSFLRSRMDDYGWVPISLISSFRRVEQLTKDIPLILESLRYSLVVEVQGDKVRRRNEWKKWLLPTGVINSDAIVHVNGNVGANP